MGGFAIGFFPFWIGPYLLGMPGIFKWIPIAQLGYLVAAWLIGRGRSAPVEDDTEVVDSGSIHSL